MSQQKGIYSLTGLRFKKDGKNRPTIRQLGNGEYMIHVEDRILVISKDNLDGLLELLLETKKREYIIIDEENK
jgi:hypothetical protein